MHESEDMLQVLVRDRLERARADAARRALLRAGRPETRLRRRLGLALIRAGQWLAGPARPARPRALTPAVAEARHG
jgi:hypothetical protein